MSEDNNDEDITEINHCFWIFIYTIMYIFVTIFVFGYGLFQSLPENDNIFGVNSYYALKSVTTTLSLILSVSKSLITPNLIAVIFTTFNISYKYRNDVIMFLRTFLVIIVPIISSMFFINECGNGWAQFWNYCSTNEKSMFDVSIDIQFFGDFSLYIHAQNYQFQFNNLLTSSEVCSIEFPSADNVSKCIRRFCDLWINILFESMIILLFMPIFILFYKIIKNKIFNKNYLYLSIDSEYTMIATKLEICMVFGLICPLLLPLIICILKWNEIFYCYITHKLQWKIKFSYNNNVPVIWLYFSLCMQHIFSFLFLYYYQYPKLIKPSYNKYMSILFVFIIILAYLIILVCGRIRVQKPNIEKKENISNKPEQKTESMKNKLIDDNSIK